MDLTFRMGFDVSYKRQITDNIDFVWQVQYLVRLGNDFSWQVQHFVIFWGWNGNYLYDILK